MFKKNKPGEIDQNINRAGRPPKSGDKPTNRQLRERELLMLLRKIRPHVADSIMTSVQVMKNTEGGDQNKLRAAEIILKNYHRLVLDLYNGEDDTEATEIQEQNRPLFSLRMIGGNEVMIDGSPVDED